MCTISMASSLCNLKGLVPLSIVVLLLIYIGTERQFIAIGR
jgi:hypothetical protein